MTELAEVNVAAATETVKGLTEAKKPPERQTGQRPILRETPASSQAGATRKEEVRKGPMLGAFSFAEETSIDLSLE